MRYDEPVCVLCGRVRLLIFRVRLLIFFQRQVFVYYFFSKKLRTRPVLSGQVQLSRWPSAIITTRNNCTWPGP
jgi:hypothetical protein